MSAVNAVNALTRRWAEHAPDRSSVLAGACAWPLLALLAPAATGKVRDELEEAAGLDADACAEAAREILEILERSPAVKAALGLWAKEGLPLRPEWTGSLPAGVRGELTGSAPADQARLDAWAAERTGGLISAMPVTMTEETLLVLAAALSVRTRWFGPFNEHPGTFENGPWSGRTAAMLSRVTTAVDLRVTSGHDGPLTLVRVQGDGLVDVHLVLGPEETPASRVLTGAIDALTGVHPVTEAADLPLDAPGPGIAVKRTPSLFPGDVLDVTVPRFSVRSSHDLLALPRVFGLSSATDDSAGHFPGISDFPLAVSEAAQEAVARFRAEGFEAAAVTAVAAPAGAAPPTETVEIKRFELTIDRPFGFVAVDRANDLILSAGWVAEPDAPESPPESPPETFPETVAEPPRRFGWPRLPFFGRS